MMRSLFNQLSRYTWSALVACKTPFVVALGICASFAVSVPAFAQWPTQPVRVIVPAPAGSAPDTMMRGIGEKMALRLGQPVVIDNKPGAGGQVAINALKSARDGHTVIFMFTSAAVLSPLLMQAAKYDVVKELKFIASLAETPLMIVSAPNARAKNLAELIKLGKDNPGKVIFGNPGPTTLGRLSAEYLSQLTGAQFQMVPFSNPGASLSALVNGDMEYYIDGVAVMLPYLKAVRIAPIALLSGGSLPGLESYRLGQDTLPGFQTLGRFGLMSSPELSADASLRLANAAISALAEPDVVERLRTFGTYPKPGTAAAYAEIVKTEQEQWTRVVRATGLEPQ